MRLSHLIALTLAVGALSGAVRAQTGAAPMSIADANRNPQTLCEYKVDGTNLGGCTINWLWNGSAWGLQPADSGFRPYVDVYSLPSITGTVTANAGTGTFGTQDGADTGVTAGTAPSKAQLGAVQYNSAAPTLTTGQTVAAQADVNGNLKVNCVTGCGVGGGSGGAVYGPTAVGSAAANPPVLIGGTADGTATGNVGVWQIVNGIGSVSIASGQVVSGAYADCAITTIGCETDAAWSGTGAATLMAAIKKLDADVTSPIPANSKVGIDQTTPGSTNAVQAVAGSTGGSTPVSIQVAANTTPVAICTSACTLYSAIVQNSGSGVLYAKLYNAAVGSVTCGSGTPADRLMIPANTSGAGAVYTMGGSVGVAYGTALTACITAGFADTDTTAPAANTSQISFDKK